MSARLASCGRGTHVPLCGAASGGEHICPCLTKSGLAREHLAGFCFKHARLWQTLCSAGRSLVNVAPVLTKVWSGFRRNRPKLGNMGPILDPARSWPHRAEFDRHWADVAPLRTLGQHHAWVCPGGCLSDVDYGDLPWPAGTSVELGRSQLGDVDDTPCFGSHFGHGFDCRDPCAMRRIASGPRTSSRRPKLEPKHGVSPIFQP